MLRLTACHLSFSPSKYAVACPLDLPNAAPTPVLYQHWYRLLPSFSSVQFSRLVVSGSLWPCGLQHTRPPCPSPTPGVYPNSWLLSRWHHPTISSSVIPFSSLPSIFPSIRVFSNESVLHIRWPKFWSFSFSISPSNEYSGLISFRMDWLDLLAVQGTLKSLLEHHSCINSSALSFLYRPTLTSIRDYWKNFKYFLIEV